MGGSSIEGAKVHRTSWQKSWHAGAGVVHLFVGWTTILSYFLYGMSECCCASNYLYV